MDNVTFHIDHDLIGKPRIVKNGLFQYIVHGVHHKEHIIKEVYNLHSIDLLLRTIIEDESQNLLLQVPLIFDSSEHLLGSIKYRIINHPNGSADIITMLQKDTP